MSVKLFFTVFLTFYCHNFVTSISKHPIILIISYDGFRYDYIDTKGANPILGKLRSEGAHAKYLNNAFMTKTFPNHHTIATGLYPESHGVLGNTLYDPLYNRVLNYSYEFWHCSEDVLPIWIANEKKGGGRHSGIMMWPGNEYNYTGIYPTHQRNWEKNFSWEDRVDGVISWIRDPVKPANLVLMYIEEPDVHGHSYGPHGPEHVEELRAMDKITGYLMRRLNETGLIDIINLFFVSDHGMESVTKRDVIDLREIVPVDKYDRYEGSPVFHLYPKEGEMENVYSALKNASKVKPFNVYKTNEIPERWHYKNNRRTPPILAVADVPHVFQDFYNFVAYEESVRNFTAKDNDTFGVHGYDNQVMTMKPYFFALGPMIKKSYEIEPFETVDLFSLWAHMLGFPELAAQTNGSFARVSKLLVNDGKPSGVGNIGGAFVGVLLVGISIGTAVYFVQRRLKTHEKFYFQRLSQDTLESRQRLLDGTITEEEA